MFLKEFSKIGVSLIQLINSTNISKLINTTELEILANKLHDNHVYALINVRL